MGKFQNLTGQKFGRLTVIERVKNIGRSIAWLCRCQCGNETIVIGDHLKSGHTKSCGCLQKERIIKRSTRHGLRWTRLYYIWAGMKQRCNNGESSRYKDYGARGIKICTEWEHNFQSFYVWSMVNGYQDGLTIDRIDVNEGYNPSNCRWANSIEQGRKQTKQCLNKL